MNFAFILINLNISHRKGGCVLTRSLRYTERVGSSSWPPWLGREISMCLKSGGWKGGCQRNCTVTQKSQVRVLHAALHKHIYFLYLQVGFKALFKLHRTTGLPVIMLENECHLASLCNHYYNLMMIASDA